MGWYDSAWTYRAAVSVDNATPGATIDVSIPIAASWDLFWDNIQTDGDDVRLTQADGVTLLNYDLNGFNYSAKTVTLRIDGLSSTATAGVYVVWLYWGNAAATDGSTAVTISAALSGYVHLGRPTGWRMPAVPANPGSTKPVKRVQKTTNEEIVLWINIAGMLERSRHTSSGRIQYEEPYSVVMTVTDGGSGQAGMIDQTRQRFVETKDGLWVGCLIKAGSDATDYTIEPVITTVIPEVEISIGVLQQGQHKIIEPRAHLRIEDISEA